MPQSKPRRRSGRGEVLPPLSKLEKITDLLKTQLETFPQKELSPEEIERWVKDLEPFEIVAIEAAFDAHRRNGLFFPVPGQILDLCIAWQPEPKYKPGCSRECLARHGKGYNENDIAKLWKLYAAKLEQLPNRSLTDGEVNQLLDELDRWRGHSPEWRAA
jgi:hypothetical protein